jgi:hypothetical protein
VDDIGADAIVDPIQQYFQYGSQKSLGVPAFLLNGVK